MAIENMKYNLNVHNMATEKKINFSDIQITYIQKSKIFCLSMTIFTV